MKKLLLTSTAVVTLAAGSVHAATIVGFEAESGTLGSEYNTGVDATALGGSYIEHANNSYDDGPNANQPNTVGFTVSYNLNLDAGTYDVYVKLRFANNGDDSFFIANSFGDKDPTVTADWLKIEYQDGGFPANQLTFAWSDALPITLTAPGGPVTWEIGARENGLDTDAFAFVLRDDPLLVTSVTDTDLDNAVLGVIPEPSSAALLGLGSLALILRRRRK